MNHSSRGRHDCARLLRINLAVFRRNAWGALRLLSLALALVIPALTISQAWALVGRMPTWDEWSQVEVWDASYSGAPVVPLLLKNYNGHWNCFPRTLYFLLGCLDRWNLRVEVWLGYLAALATLGLLLRMLRELRPGLLVLAAV